MGYVEPPRLYQPVRQCLGWAHLAAWQHTFAAATYMRDLAEYPQNGWSLSGLAAAYEGMDRPRTAKALGPSVAAAWRSADVAIPSSCPQLSE